LNGIERKGLKNKRKMLCSALLGSVQVILGHHEQLMKQEGSDIIQVKQIIEGTSHVY
jgi:hypothetical protein